MVCGEHSGQLDHLSWAKVERSSVAKSSSESKCVNEGHNAYDIDSDYDRWFGNGGWGMMLIVHVNMVVNSTKKREDAHYDFRGRRLTDFLVEYVLVICKLSPYSN